MIRRWKLKDIKFQIKINDILWKNYNDEDINHLVWLVKLMIKNWVIEWKNDCLVLKLIEEAKKQLWTSKNLLEEKKD